MQSEIQEYHNSSSPKNDDSDLDDVVPSNIQAEASELVVRINDYEFDGSID